MMVPPRLRKAFQTFAGGLSDEEVMPEVPPVMEPDMVPLIVPDMVHVLAGGRIVKEGGKELALELEEKGYDWVKAAAK